MTRWDWKDGPPDLGTPVAVKGHASARPWFTRVRLAVAGLLCLLLAGAITTAVVAPLCLLVGCNGHDNTLELAPGPARLLVKYNNHSVDALSLIPAVLRQYVSQLQLGSSAIQVLSFATEEVLQEALQYISSDPSLSMLARDFVTDIVTPVMDELVTDSSDKAKLASALSQLQIALGGAAQGAAAPQREGVLLQEDDPLVAFAVNDPLYVNGSQYYTDLTNATGAWKLATGTPDVIVAIIDSGVYLDHPDLQGTLWVNSEEIPDNGIDDDGNGYVDDVHGYAFAGRCTSHSSSGSCTACGGTASPFPDAAVDSKFYHGTHVAGLVAATQNNAQGISGVAAGVKLMILRVSDCIDGTIAASTVFTALDYALRMGAHVVSMALGSSYAYGFAPSTPAPSYHAQWTASYQTALQPLADKGILIVVAAGNDNINLNSLASLGWAYTPCLVDISTLICVGGTDVSDQRAAFSNYGSTSVHIGSPAMQIYSTLIQSVSGVVQPMYGPLDGTSMAMPIVSAAAALTLSSLGASDNNYFKALQVKAVLLSTGNQPSTGPLPFVSGSRVNPGLAVWQATTQLQTVVVSPVYGTYDALPAIMYFQGLAESYYATPASSLGAGAGSVGPLPLDVSVRNVSRANNQPTTFTAFKHSSGVTVVLSALLRLNSAGRWSVCMQMPSTSTGSAWLVVNGLKVILNSTTGTGTFVTTDAGWFRVELHLSGLQTPPYRLLFKSPRSATFKPYYAFLVAGPATSDFENVQNRSLADAWQVSFYTTSTDQPLALMSQLSTVTLGQTAAAQLTQSLQLQDPSGTLLPTTLVHALANSSAAAVVGSMQTFLLPTVAWTQPMAFKVSCLGCQLLVDGVVVLDVFEPLLGSEVALTSTTKTSACLTLASGWVHQLSLTFALQLANTFQRWEVGYANCTGQADFASLAGLNYIPEP